MRGLIFRGYRQIELTDFPDPVPGAGEVRVKLGRAAVCGTDVHLYVKPPEKIGALPNGQPMIPGHEPAGWIDALGPGVTRLQVGQRVVMAGVMGCGQCNSCRLQMPNSCEIDLSALGWNRHGADATMLVVPAANAIALPEEVSLDTATVLTCAGCTAYTIVRETHLGPEDRLAIIGLGPVGLCLTILAKAMGIATIGFDRLPQRIAMAMELGLDRGVNVDAEEAVGATRAWARSRGVEVVAECVGQPATQKLAMQIGANRARIAMAGLGGDAIEVKLDRDVIDRQYTIIGLVSMSMRYLPELVERTARYNLPFDRMITHHFPLERAAEAFALMERGESAKVVFDLAETF